VISLVRPDFNPLISDYETAQGRAGKGRFGLFGGAIQICILMGCEKPAQRFPSRFSTMSVAPIRGRVLSEIGRRPIRRIGLNISGNETWLILNMAIVYLLKLFLLYGPDGVRRIAMTATMLIRQQDYQLWPPRQESMG
jgi:hypothetical protein